MELYRNGFSCHIYYNFTNSKKIFFFILDCISKQLWIKWKISVRNFSGLKYSSSINLTFSLITENVHWAGGLISLKYANNTHSTAVPTEVWWNFGDILSGGWMGFANAHKSLTKLCAWQHAKSLQHCPHFKPAFKCFITYGFPLRAI